MLSRVDRSEGIKFDLAGMFQFGPQQNSALPLSPVTGQPVEGEDEEEGPGGHHHW